MKKTTPSAAKDVEQLELPPTAGGVKIDTNTLANCLAVSVKTEHRNCLEPSNSTPRYIPNRHV